VENCAIASRRSAAESPHACSDVSTSINCSVPDRNAARTGLSNGSRATSPAKAAVGHELPAWSRVRVDKKESMSVRNAAGRSG
jgi:hypothetical protein